MQGVPPSATPNTHLQHPYTCIHAHRKGQARLNPTPYTVCVCACLCVSVCIYIWNATLINKEFGEGQEAGGQEAGGQEAGGRAGQSSLE